MKYELGNKNSFSIIFYLYDDGKKSAEKKVYCRIRIKRVKAEFCLQITSPPEEWDSELQTFKGSTQYFRRQGVKLTELRTKLEDIYEKIQNDGYEATPQMVRDTYLGKITTSPLPTNILEFIDYFVEEIKQLPDEYGHETINKYKNLKAHFTRFLLARGLKNFPVSKMSPGILDSFYHHLKSVPNEKLGQAMCPNSANGLMIKLKVVLKKAVRHGLLLFSPFDEFRLKKVKPEKAILTSEEIARIANHTLAGNAALIRARDSFCFCIYTTLRFSDALALKAENIVRGDDGKLWLSFKQQKTQSTVYIPLLKAAEEIYNKYESSRRKTGYVLPRLSNQKMNNHLKEIANLTGITKKLTSHTARHTGATQMLNNFIPIAVVSEWMGHKSISVTQQYAKVTTKQLSQSADQLDKDFERSKLQQKMKQEIESAMRQPQPQILVKPDSFSLN